VAVVAACSDDSTLPPTAPTTGPPSGIAFALTPDAAHTALSGGATTVFDVTTDAFSHESPNLSAAELALHEEGDEQFEIAFVPGVSKKKDVPGGLGPVFDNVSCEGCHEGDGRGRPPLPGEPFESFLFRISIPGKDGTTGGTVGVPMFGGQLQLRASPGLKSEAVASITYTELAGQFADGTPYSLRVPGYEFYDTYAPLSSKLLFSPRSAPFNFGLGLLEAIPEWQIRANEDANDKDGNDVSGRVNMVWDVAAGRTAVGRFGWKAGAPNLIQQTAGAYNGDMGVTSSMFPAEPCEGDRTECKPHPVEVSDETVVAVARYMQTLAVPARRNLEDAQATQGEAIFYQVGCTDCHTPSFTTETLAGVPSVTGQKIHPYTDLLLHDMGDELADGVPDENATGREWRTTPLIGLRFFGSYLHDARAHSIDEAITMHAGVGSQANESVARYQALSPSQRAELLRFVTSL